MRANILMNNRFFSVLSLIVVLFVCSSFREPKWCKLSNRVVKGFLKEFVKSKKLHMNSSGGAFMYDIEVVSHGFISFDRLTVDEARVLYVEMMEEFLSRMNQNEKVQPYLHNHPFGPDNYELMIGFEDSQRKITSDGHVALMSIVKDQELCFRGYDPDIKKFYPLHREPYEESVRIVQQQKSACQNPSP